MRRIINLVASIAFLSAFCAAVRAQSPNLVPRGSEQPSFDCAQAKTAAARLICADGELARLDGELGTAFGTRKTQLSASGQSHFFANELTWIRDRNEHCGLVGKNDAPMEVLASSKPCMVSAIRDRIAFLAVESLEKPAHNPPSARSATPSKSLASNEAPSAPGVKCYSNGDTITLQGIARPQPLELADNSIRTVWVLTVDNPICVLDVDANGGQDSHVTLVQIIGSPPPTGTEIELAGTLSTGNITQYYAVPTAISVIRGRRIAASPSPQTSQAAGTPMDDQLAALLKACDDKAARARTIAAGLRPDAFMAQNPDFAAMAYHHWQADLREQLDEVEHDRQRCRQQAPFVLANEQAKAQHLQAEKEGGYKRITFDDFKLDGKQLAASESKIAITGVYLKVGDVEYLFPTILAIATLRETLNTDTGIGLLADDAPRNIRKYFLDCENNPATAQIGCPINVLGHATMCTRTSLLSGYSTDMPCVAIEDGW